MAGASPSVTEPIERSWVGVKVSGDKNGDNVVYQIVYQINHPFLEVLILTHTPTAPEKSENQEPTPHETIAEKLCESAF